MTAADPQNKQASCQDAVPRELLQDVRAGLHAGRVKIKNKKKACELRMFDSRMFYIKSLTLNCWRIKCDVISWSKFGFVSLIKSH